MKTGILQAKRVSLRAHMGLLLVVFLVVGLAAGFYATSQADQAAQSYAMQASQRAALATAQQIELYLTSDKASLEAQAASPQMLDSALHPSSCKLSYSAIGPNDRGHLDLVSPSGAVLCSSLSHTEASYASAPWLQSGAQRTVVQGYDDATAGPSLVLATPVGSVAELVNIVSTAPVARAVEGLYGNVQHLEFLITNTTQTRVVSRSLDPTRWAGQPLGHTPFGAATGNVRPDVTGTSRIYGEATIGSIGWRVYVGQDAKTALAGANSARAREFALIAVGLAIALLATFVVYRRITRAIRSLNRDVEVSTSSSGNPTPVTVSGPTEIASLGEGVNALIDTVRFELAERERAEAVYRALFDANPLPMWVFDLETFEFIEVNDAATIHYGYSREEFLSMGLSDLWADAEPAGLRTAILTGAPLDRSGPWQHRKADGSLAEVMVTSRSLMFRGRPARFDVGEDVTDQERIRKQVSQSQRLESLGQLAGGVAHDFNNLLSVIMGYLGFVKEWVSAQAVEGGEEAEHTIEDIDQIESAANRAAGLTRQLLSFARNETSEPRLIAVDQMIGEVEQLLKRTIGEQIDLATRVEPDTWPVLADPGQLERVLINLAINARDAMPGGGKLSIDVFNVNVDEAYAASWPGITRGRFVRMQVSDTGTGMTAEAIERAFEPFFTTKPLGEGSGLGLSTAYGIVNSFGGSIHIYSELGVGTNITVLLPEASGHPGAVPVATTNGHHAREATETVLIVEDEEGIRKVSERILSRSGYSVLSASNGEEALKLAGDYPGQIDLLLTDVVMPHMLGNEVAQRIRAIRSNIRVVYMSGYPETVLDRTQHLEEDVNLINKPFGETELLTKLRVILDA